VTKKIIQPQPTVKSERDSRITVNANWQRTEKMSPAFKRLMMLLLRERIENGKKTTERESTRRDYQVL